MRIFATSILLIFVILLNSMTGLAAEIPGREGPFAPGETFLYRFTDWGDVSVAEKTGARYIGSPHGYVFDVLEDVENFGTDRYKMHTRQAHRAGLKHLVHLTLLTSAKAVGNGQEHLAKDISGRGMSMVFGPTKLPYYSVFDPAVKAAIIEYMKACMELGVDGFCNDSYGSALAAVADGGDFSEAALIQFRNYLKSCYSASQLRSMGIADINSFDYGLFIRQKHLAAYRHVQLTKRLEVPFFRDFINFQALQEKAMWSDIYQKIRAYAKQKGREVLIASNAAENANDGTTMSMTMLSAAESIDAFTSEYDYGIPPGSNALAWYKTYNAMGKSVVSLTNDLFTAKLLLRPDIGELMKLYIMEAYSTGNFIYVPYANECLNSERTEYRLYTNDNLPRLYRYFDFVGDYGSCFGKPYASGKIGVFYSFASLKEESLDYTFDKTNGCSNFFGIVDLLRQQHYQYDVLFAGDDIWMKDTLSIEKLRQYPVIILPGTHTMTEKQTERLLGYIHGGGKVLAFGACAKKNERVKPHTDKLFASLLKEGINKYGKGVFIYTKQELGYLFNSSGAKKYADTLAALMKKASYSEDIVTNASANVSILQNTNTDFGGQALHLLNYNFSGGAFKPQKNIEISLTGNSETVTNPGVFLLRPEGEEIVELQAIVSGKHIKFTIPEVKDYAMVCIGDKHRTKTVLDLEFCRNRLNKLEQSETTEALKTKLKALDEIVKGKKYEQASGPAKELKKSITKLLAEQSLNHIENTIAYWKACGRTYHQTEAGKLIEDAQKAFAKNRMLSCIEKTEEAWELLAFITDGSSGDWKGMASVPINTGGTGPAKKGDIEQIYCANDDSYIYFSVRLKDFDKGKSNLLFHMNWSYNDGTGRYYEIRTRIHKNEADVLTNTEDGGYDYMANIGCRGEDVVEFKLPLDIMRKPESIDFTVVSMLEGKTLNEAKGNYALYTGD